MSNDNNVQDISISKLFQNLQKEYLICELRSKIYPLENDKKYWEKICNFKKEKILNISVKNYRKSIFDSVEIRKSFESQIYNDFGLPNFYYSNERSKEEQKYWDAFNYFTVGTEVSYVNEINSSEDYIKEGIKEKRSIIVENLVKQQQVILNNSEKSVLNYNQIKRVF